MPRFFRVSDNSFFARGFPWIWKLAEGLGEVHYCTLEDRAIQEPVGDLVALLERSKGTKWPDVLGCGDYPLFIVSERTVECWAKERVGTFPAHRVRFASPLPKRLMGTTPPAYFWIDGAKLKGALMDFEASGFVDVSFCPECGTRNENEDETNRRYIEGGWPYVFRENTWAGLNLFTTDLCDTQFFCTEVVVECARKYKLTNFEFVPIEERSDPWNKCIKYM
jgi:hypothetical protein